MDLNNVELPITVGLPSSPQVDKSASLVRLAVMAVDFGKAVGLCLSGNASESAHLARL